MDKSEQEKELKQNILDHVIFGRSALKFTENGIENVSQAEIDELINNPDYIKETQDQIKSEIISKYDLLADNKLKHKEE